MTVTLEEESPFMFARDVTIQMWGCPSGCHEVRDAFAVQRVEREIQSHRIFLMSRLLDLMKHTRWPSGQRRPNQKELSKPKPKIDSHLEQRPIPMTREGKTKT